MSIRSVIMSFRLLLIFGLTGSALFCETKLPFYLVDDTRAWISREPGRPPVVVLKTGGHWQPTSEGVTVTAPHWQTALLTVEPGGGQGQPLWDAALETLIRQSQQRPAPGNQVHVVLTQIGNNQAILTFVGLPDTPAISALLTRKNDKWLGPNLTQFEKTLGLPDNAAARWLGYPARNSADLPVILGEYAATLEAGPRVVPRSVNGPGRIEQRIDVIGEPDNSMSWLQVFGCVFVGLVIGVGTGPAYGRVMNWKSGGTSVSAPAKRLSGIADKLIPIIKSLDRNGRNPMQELESKCTHVKKTIAQARTDAEIRQSADSLSSLIGQTRDAGQWPDDDRRVRELASLQDETARVAELNGDNSRQNHHSPVNMRELVPELKKMLERQFGSLTPPATPAQLEQTEKRLVSALQAKAPPTAEQIADLVAQRQREAFESLKNLIPKTDPWHDRVVSVHQRFREVAGKLDFADPKSDPAAWLDSLPETLATSIAALQKKIESADQRASVMKNELETLNSGLREFLGDYGAESGKDGSLVALRKLAQSQTSKATELTGKVTELTGEVAQLTGELNKLLTERDHAREEIARLTPLADAARSLKQDVQRLNADLTAARDLEARNNESSRRLVELQRSFGVTYSVLLEAEEKHYSRERNVGTTAMIGFLVNHSMCQFAAATAAGNDLLKRAMLSNLLCISSSLTDKGFDDAAAHLSQIATPFQVDPSNVLGAERCPGGPMFQFTIGQLKQILRVSIEPFYITVDKDGRAYRAA
jgi:hypothetical protein